MTQPDCTYVQAQLEDLLDGYLSADAAGPVRAHLAACTACAQELRELRALQTALRELPAPAPRAGFADAALAAATGRAGSRAGDHTSHQAPPVHTPAAPRAVTAAFPAPRTPRRRATSWRRPRVWVGATVSAAAAAALAVMLWGVPTQTPVTPDTVPDIASLGGSDRQMPVRMALYEPRDIGVAIEAAQAMPGAMLTISLQGGIDLVGFGERRELSWQTDLDAGTNMLSLPIIAHSLEEGTLTAHVEHGAQAQVISVRVHIDTPTAD